MTRTGLRFRRWAAVAGLMLGPVAVAAGPDGASLYQQKCALCHGKNGVPPPGMAKLGARDFTDAAWQKSKKDEEIRATVEDGKPGTSMLGFKGKLKPAEIGAIVRHLRTFTRAGRVSSVSP
ncbi:MAG TPA: cytochrome c [Vicinamibacteria bacterium]|nr:cytochrome c [Vicinamibacteria bacterium]